MKFMQGKKHFESMNCQVEGDVDTHWSLGLSGIMNQNEILMGQDGCLGELRNFGVRRCKCSSRVTGGVTR